MGRIIEKLSVICLCIAPFIADGKTGNNNGNSGMFKPLADTLVLSQADGSKLHLVCSGSFFLNYCETLDGYTVIVDAIGMYEYAKKGSRGTLIPNDMQAKDEPQRSPEDIRHLKKIPKHLRYSGETLKLFEDKQKRMDEDPAIIKRDKKIK
jgi:hypothetical protein